MLKKFSKFLLLMLIILVTSTSSIICLAHEDDEESTNNVTTTETNEETTTTDESTTEEPEIHTGDLYLFDSNIVMDKLVDGNVFIFGNNVEITGNINGNLFVVANKLTFNQSTIMYSIYACANSVYYSGGCYYGDLYVVANNIETTYSSYITRDIKAVGSNIIFKSAVGRDADFICDTLNLGEGKDIPKIYGDLRYTSNNELTIPEEVVEGSSTYTKPSLVNNVLSILICFGTCIVTALVIYFVLNKLSANFIQKISNEKFSISKILKAFGIGLATIIIISLFILLLVGSFVGIILAIILALLFTILCIIAVPVLSINITSTLKPSLKIEKKSMFYLVLVLVNVILYGITYIPFVGVFLGFIINVTSIGLIVNILFPHKELTAEEKSAIENDETLDIENKEKMKQEKLDAKENKKQEKIKAKEAKKKDKES